MCSCFLDAIKNWSEQQPTDTNLELLQPSQENFGGAAAKKAAKSEKLFECKRCTILIGSQRPLHR